MVSSHINFIFALHFSWGQGMWGLFFFVVVVVFFFQEPWEPGGNQTPATLDGRSLIFITITEFIFSSISWILSCEGNCGNSLIIDLGFLSLGGFSAFVFLAVGKSARHLSGPHAPRDPGAAPGPTEDGKAGAEIQGEIHFPSPQQGLFSVWLCVVFFSIFIF